MTESTFQLDQLTPQNVQLMQAYTVCAAAARAAEEEFDGWLERINSLPDLTTDCLIRMHGQLIAMGYLKFEISGRNVGLRYQISPKGRQALERAQLAPTTSENDDPGLTGEAA